MRDAAVAKTPALIAFGIRERGERGGFLFPSLPYLLVSLCVCHQTLRPPSAGRGWSAP